MEDIPAEEIESQYDAAVRRLGKVVERSEGEGKILAKKQYDHLIDQQEKITLWMAIQAGKNANVRSFSPS